MTTLEQLVKSFADNIDRLEVAGKALKKQIDQLVYDLYDLTEEEIKIVEVNFHYI
jgi:ribosomal protein L23